MGKVNVDREANTAAAVAKDEPKALEKTTLLLGDYVPELKDIILPRLNIVHDISDLHKVQGFESGSILFNQNTVLFQQSKKQGDKVISEGTPPLIGIVLGFKPITYIEDVKGGGMGMYANTTQEVINKGGTLDYNESGGKKLFVPQATALMAVRRPDHLENDGTVFTYEVGDAQYALALWAFKKSAYTAACKATLFFHRTSGCLKVGGYPSWSWKISTFLKDFKQSNTSAWVPEFKPNARSTEAELAFSKQVLEVPSVAPGTDAAE
jgi:hypothetical protein